MKRFLLALLVAILAASLAVPASAHEGEQEDGEDFTLNSCIVPITPVVPFDGSSSQMIPIDPEALVMLLKQSPPDGLDDYQLFIYAMEMLGIPELHASDPDHEQFHEHMNLVEWDLPFENSPNSGEFTTFDGDGCHGNYPIWDLRCVFDVFGVCIYKVWYVKRMHYRHCIHDKCGGHPCP